MSNKFIFPVFQSETTNAGTAQTGINVNGVLKVVGRGSLFISVGLTAKNNFDLRSTVDSTTANLFLLGDLSAIAVSFVVGGPVGFVGGLAFSALGGTQGISNKAVFISNQVDEQASAAAGNIIKNSNEQSIRRLLNIPPAIDINFK